MLLLWLKNTVVFVEILYCIREVTERRSLSPTSFVDQSETHILSSRIFNGAIIGFIVDTDCLRYEVRTEAEEIV
jgi:hypothetical protein